MHFDLTKYPRLSVRSFDMIEMTGRDSLDAVARAAPPPRSDGTVTPLSGFQLNTLHTNQLIAGSITHVDGQPVVRPYTAWEDWSTRTQEFVISAYQKLNGAQVDELKDFLAASFASPGAGSSPPSSASTGSSPGT